MEFKRVTLGEIEDLLELSRDIGHPYFYRFSYKPGKGYFAKRMKKDAIRLRSERTKFHMVDLNQNDMMAKAINRIERIKENMGSLIYAGR